MAEARDLFADFPDLDTSDATGFCTSDPGSIRRNGGKSYRSWEDEVARPALEAAGYRDVSFSSIEADSFGPLIRGVTATSSDGKVMEWDYG